MLLKIPCFLKDDSKQFPTEEEGTEVIDTSDAFVCRLREVPAFPNSQPGVAVIDVYFKGAGGQTDPAFIGDSILMIVACVDEVCDAEIRDLCILGFPACSGIDTCKANKVPNAFSFLVTFGGEQFVKHADPIFPFASCEDAAIWERTFFIGQDQPLCSS
ncbi:MAG: hypothetical protein ACREOW_06965 [Thermodesulfobacteriota bacterium]